MAALRTLTAGELAATFVPDAGMIGCSLTHRGAEVLGQRGGLESYIAERKTMGIPFLHPWANRLAKTRFTLAGREVHIDTSRTRVDAGGLPMHGLLGAAPGWQVEHHDDTRLVARFDFALESFPVPQTIVLEATLAPQALTITTTITADEPVPIAFGFHPYQQLPGLPREEWIAEIPVTEQLLLDDAMLPTGERKAVHIDKGPIGTYDDAYTAPAAPFALEGPDRRIELAFHEGFPYSQVFAPPGEPLVAFEPMTAPTNALVSGQDLPFADHYRAEFSIRVH
jgi:galactose mutarotase-like enzyme